MNLKLLQFDFLGKRIELTVILYVVLLFFVTGGAFVALGVFGERPARLLLRPLAVLPRLSVERMNVEATNLIRGLTVFRRPAAALPVFALTFGARVRDEADGTAGMQTVSST